MMIGDFATYLAASLLVISVAGGIGWMLVGRRR